MALSQPVIDVALSLADARRGQSRSRCLPAPGRRHAGKCESSLQPFQSPLVNRLRVRCAAFVDTAAPPEPRPLLLGEDFQKAGGTEVGFVEMQSKKDGDGQESMSRMLQRLAPSVTRVLDVAVVGCGPSGLALASELGKRGLEVGVIGRDMPFVNTYGVWPDEFLKVGYGGCIDQVWEETLLYTQSDTPIQTGRPYARVDRKLLRKELLERCQAAGVEYLGQDAGEVVDSNEEGSTVVTVKGERVRARLVVIAAGAASGKFLKYASSTAGVGVQTAYGIKVEMESPYPYSAEAMLFMDYRDLPPPSTGDREVEKEFLSIPSFLYAMPTTPTKVFFEETCLAARPAMPFSVLKERLRRRLQGLGVKYRTVHEEEWSYIPVGGDLPDTTQQLLGFGAAASLIHPATGYSLTRSLSEAPEFAAAIARALHSTGSNPTPAPVAAGQAWDFLWSQERKRQRAFMIFGLELILQLDTASTREFFSTFFKLPPWLWQGFLASSLSSTELLLFALNTFAVAPNGLRFQLVKHLITDPSGARMLRVYAGQS